jgi:site-specific recombinase XerD
VPKARSLPLFSARRADIEAFARDMEARGRARATVTVTRRLCTIAGLYKYAVEEELLDHSPAAHVRRPRLDYESHATALDRNELGALLVAAGLGPPAEHVISLLALNGLRVSEATGADIEHLGLERGHRTLVVTRKGGKVVTIPLAPLTARAIDLAVGERTEGPLFVTADGRRLDRHGAARIVRRVTRRAGIDKHVSPRTLRHAFITAALDAGVPLRDVQEAASHADPRTTMRYDRARASLDTGTPPTSSPPTSPEPRDSPAYQAGWPRRGPACLASTPLTRRAVRLRLNDRFACNPHRAGRSARATGSPGAVGWLRLLARSPVARGFPCRVTRFALTLCGRARDRTRSLVQPRASGGPPASPRSRRPGASPGRPGETRTTVTAGGDYWVEW